jgi:hypothetical protein
MCPFLLFIDQNIAKFVRSEYYISNIWPKVMPKLYDMQQCVMFRQRGIILATGETA